jgi:hypothetical protein
VWTCRSATEVPPVYRVAYNLLHTPTVQVMRLAGGTGYVRALCELFELDPQIPAAVAVARRGDVLPVLDASAMPDEAVLAWPEVERSRPAPDPHMMLAHDGGRACA